MKIVTKTGDHIEPPRSKGILGVILFIAAALIIGVALTIWLASRSNDDQKQTAGTTLEKQLERDYGSSWRDLGVTKWEHEAGKATVFFVEADEWAKLKKGREKEIMKILWQDIATLSKAEEIEDDEVSIMIHSEEDRMIGAYDKEHGVTSYD